MADRAGTRVERPRTNGGGDRSSVHLRPLVPTPREIEAGLHADDPGPGRPVAHEPRTPWRDVVAGWVRNLDPRTIEGPKLPLVTFALLALVTSWDDIALSVLLPEVRAEFALNVEFLARIGAVFATVAIALGPLMGYLADRVRRVWMVRIGALLGNSSSVLTAMAPGVPFLVGARTLGGLAKATSEPAAFPLFTDYYRPGSRARVFFVFFAAAAAGGVLGPAVSGQLGERFGWRPAVASLGLVAMVVSLLTFLLREPPRGATDRESQSASPDAPSDQRPVSWAEGWRAGSSIRTLRRIWYATPFLYAGGLGINLLLALYFAEVFQLGPEQRGYVATLGGVSALVGLVAAGPLADRLLASEPGRLMMLTGVLVAGEAVAFVLLAVSPSLALSIVLSLPIALVGALVTPTLITLMSVVVPARVRGLGIQTSAPWQLLGIVAFPFIIGFADAWGIRGGMAIFAPVVGIGAVILGTAAPSVARDIRSARAASVADEAAMQADAEGTRKLLVCRDIDVEFGGAQVLFGVDFDVDEGEMVALVGTNGAGKSTLLAAIAGTHQPSSGAVFLDGEDITHAPPHEIAARDVALMPGGRAVFPALTVRENLEAATWLFREDDTSVSERMGEALDRFPDLRRVLDQPAGNLSGGEQQMVGLAQALLMRPRLLMIDELSLGLAPTVVESLLEVLREIHRRGTTVILVEQSLNVALSIAERSVFMEKGQVRFSGPTRELMERGDLVKAVFMGAAPARSERAAPAPLEDDGGERDLLSVEGVGASFGGVQALTDVSLGVRPEEIVGIIGPNGAGKTTLFDVISGFVAPDRGAVVLDGHDLTGAQPELRARIGLGRSFQNAFLFPSLTVRETIAVALERQVAKNPLLAAAWTPAVRRSEGRIFRRVDALIELLGLGDDALKFVGELSTGTRRAVDVACAMAQEPRLLLLDEPSSGLAQAEAEGLAPTLHRLVRETGCALLVIEHDVPLVTGLSDRLVAMELGQVIATGAPDEVVSDPRVLESYLAASDEVLERSGARGAKQRATSKRSATRRQRGNSTTRPDRKDEQ